MLVAVRDYSEVSAIGYMPAVPACVLLILRGKYLGGTALMTLFFSLEVSVLHLQIIYYTGLIIGILVLVYWITHWNEKKFKHMAIATALICVPLILGLLNYAYILLPTRELVSETMRGVKSQLTQ